MSIESDKESFLSRWSRLKKEAESPPQQDKTPPPLPAKPKPELPPVESLSLDSDFSGFLHPEVDEQLRKVALRKLFSDPHFNVMDGLDVYIDDYNKYEPIPPDMLAKLVQYSNLLGGDKRAEEKGAEGEKAETVAGPSDPCPESPQHAENQQRVLAADEPVRAENLQSPTRESRIDNLSQFVKRDSNETSDEEANR